VEHEKFVRALMHQYYRPQGKLNTEEDAYCIIQKAVMFATANFDANRNVKITTYLHSVIRNTIRNIQDEESRQPKFESPEDFDPACSGSQTDFEFVNDMASVLSPKELDIFWLVQANTTKEEMHELGYSRHEVEKCFEGIKRKYLSLEENPKLQTTKKKRSKRESSLLILPQKQSGNTLLAVGQ
jgi:hypothetical protein